MQVEYLHSEFGIHLYQWLILISPSTSSYTCIGRVLKPPNLLSNYWFETKGVGSQIVFVNSWQDPYL